MSLPLLQDLYWKEIVLPGKKLSQLPANFYPALRRYLARLKEAGSSDEYEKASRLANDIVNCRLRKTLGLVGISPPRDVLENLSEEERTLYDRLQSEVERYRSKILELRP
jgi:DNA replication initiation complex subunit (GINS family)